MIRRPPCGSADAESVFGTRSEPDLIDQLGFHQFVENRIDPRIQQPELNREPITAAALIVLLAAVPRRSMRAPIAACRVAGTLTSPHRPGRHSCRCSLEYSAFGEVADHLLREKWVAGGSRQIGGHPADRGVRAEHLGNQG